MSFISRSSAAILIGLALFVILATVGFATVASVDRAARSRDQARAAVLTGTQLLAAMLDIETGQRGYVLTGNDEYLDSYREGVRLYPLLLERLHAQAAGMGDAPARVARIDRLVRLRAAISARVLAARRGGGFEAAREAMRTLRGRDVTEQIRDELDGLDDQLDRLIRIWDRQTFGVTREARWTAVGLALLGTVLILASILVLEREHARRQSAESALQDANARLEARVLERTAELEQARRQLQSFARRLDRQVEGERRRLAREVHDQLGQIFTALKLTLSHTAAAHPGIAMPLSQAVSLLDEGVVTARRIASELRPPLLDDLGLAAAIDHRGQRFQEETRIECDVDVDDAIGLGPEQSMQLFRIVQEALTNVARHADASRVRIEGRVHEGMYVLSVQDDGRGMAEPHPASLGMLSMLERTLLSGGLLTVDSAPGRGTRIGVTLPLQAQGETA